MIRAIFLSILMICLQAAATERPPAVDITGIQLQYEQLLSQRIQSRLDPMLGQKNYSVTVRITTTKPTTDSSREMFFAKLGMTAQLPESEAMSTYSFSDWIKSVDVHLAYADNIKSIDESKIKEDITNLVKSLGKVKINVELTKFTAVDTRIQWREQWTPFSIFILGILICLTLYWSFLKLSHAVEKTGATGVNPTPMAMDTMASPTFGSGASMPATTSAAHGGLSANEGLKKWHEWVNDYPEQAQQFVEKLTRSEQKGEKFVLAYIVQNTDLKKMTPFIKALKKDLHADFKEAAALNIDKHNLCEIDEYLLQNVTQNFIEIQTDSDNVIKAIHDFTVEECVLAAEQDPQLLALFMRHFSTPHMEQILRQTSKKTFTDFASLNGTSISVPTEALTRIRAHVLNSRLTRNQKDTSQLHKWLTVASHMDLEREYEIYRTLCAEQNDMAELQKFIEESFPQFLAKDLPEAILKPVFNSLPFKERAEFLFCLDESMRNKLIAFYKNEPKAQEFLDYEVKTLSEDAARKADLQQQAYVIHKNFHGRLRKYIASSHSHKMTAVSIFRNWVKAEVANAHAKKAA